MNHFELSALLKRTRIANLFKSSSGEEIDTLCQNEDTLKIFVDFLARTIAHMGDNFHNVSKTMSSSRTCRGGNSSIPIPRNFQMVCNSSFFFLEFFFVCLCVLQTPANVNTTHKHVHAVVQ